MESSAIRANPWYNKISPQEDLYKDLHFSSTHIRLLELLPESANFEESTKPWYEHINIRCKLLVVEVDKAPPYDALSYTWGSDEPTIEITVNEKKVMVRRNLADALAALRGQSPRLLWNDALCINQTSDPERSHQVQLMGDIYRHAATVFIWLGRSEARTKDFSKKVISILQSFAGTKPISNLPRAPPRANVPREAEFDQWIQDLKAFYKLDDEKDKKRWEEDWGLESKWWGSMKQERLWIPKRRQRKPYLIAQLETSKKSWVSSQEDVRVLQERQTAQNGSLEALQARVHHFEQAMNAPVSRMLKTFLARQEQVFLAIGFSVPPFKAPMSVPTRSTETQQLYGRISHNLGEFQRYIIDRRQQLTETLGQGFDTRAELNRLNRWSDIENDERRAFSNLQSEYQSWYSLENSQDEKLRRLRLAQDMILRNFISVWDRGRKRVLHQGQDLSLYEAQQRDKLERCISEQTSALKIMAEEHDSQRVQSPLLDPRIDSSLQKDELQNLARLKESMRYLHKQLIANCIMEILAHRSDFLSRQQGKLCYEIHNAVNRMLSQKEEKKQMRMSLIQAQGYWVWQWKQMRQKEGDQWKSRISSPIAYKRSSLTETFLALEEFCNLRYWNRLWIVQEVLLAKEPVLCFGDDARTTHDWSLLSNARRCLESIPAHWKLDALMEQQVTTVQQSFPFLLDRLRDRRNVGWPLHSLVEITGGTRCAHPRDKVYGLLGLANDCCKGDIVPDIKKSTHEVFLDTIRWYHQKYGSDDSHPSILQLSKSMQLSFRTHDWLPQLGHKPDPNLAGPRPHNIDGTQPSLSNETFCVKATRSGTIMDLRQLLDDSELSVLRPRDWIGLLAEFLDSDGTQISKTNVEKELVRLSSVMAEFAIKHQTIAYGTCEGAESIENSTLPKEGLGTAAPRLHRSNDEPQFFMLDNGDFGVASTRIRENDVLCEFEGDQTALILRQTTDHRLALVSRAIMSQLPRVAQVPDGAVDSDSEHDTTVVVEPSAQPSAINNRVEATTLYVHLDATSLQQLTEPYEISRKHKFREASFVHEADFGWHEFMNFGTDIEAETLDESLFADESATENVSIPATTPVAETETPVLVANEKVMAHTAEITTNFDSNNPPLLEMLKSALSPRPFVSQWPQSQSYGVLLDLGAQSDPITW